MLMRRGQEATWNVSLATSMPMKSGSAMVFSQSCKCELVGPAGRRRFIRLFGLVPQWRRGSRLVTVSRTRTRPISRRPRLSARLATLASPKDVFTMEPLTMVSVNIQGRIGHREFVFLTLMDTYGHRHKTRDRREKKVAGKCLFCADSAEPKGSRPISAK